VVFDPSNEKEIVKREENKDFKEIDEDGINKLFDMIMPSYDSVSGPLLFI
jgi:chorismate mutase